MLTLNTVIRELNSLLKRVSVYIPTFITAPFAIARTWKQPRCPLTDEQTKKLQHIYIIEYYSARKRNTFGSVLVKWINLEPVIQ